MTLERLPENFPANFGKNFIKERTISKREQIYFPERGIIPFRSEKTGQKSNIPSIGKDVDVHTCANKIFRDLPPCAETFPYGATLYHNTGLKLTETS